MINILGAIHFRQGKRNAAITFYKKALTITPDSFEPLFNLRVALNSLDRYKDSCTVLKKAVKINPRSFVSFHALGISFKNLRNTTAAIRCFTESLRIKPNQISTLNELGILHSQIGKNKDALKYFQKILAIQPTAIVHRHVSLVTDYTTDQTHILELKSLLSQKLDVKDEIELRYAYFKATFAQGKIDESYKSLAKSKSLRKAQSNYDIQNALQVFKKVQSFHLKHKYETPVLSRLEPGNPVNIFIVGMPRSGTTLIEQALCNHTKVFSGGELSFLGNRLYPKFLKSNSKPIDFLDLELTDLYNSYSRLTTEIQSNTDFFVDKMPTNFLWLGIIQNLFPKIKIINIKRDPMAVIWSNYKHYFSSKELGFSNSFDDIISYYQAYQNLMEFWRAKLNQNIYDLDYEKFTMNPKAELKKLLQFCELNWEEACLTFYKTDTLIQTASRDQVRKPIYQGSSNEWKKYFKYLAPIQGKAQSAGLI